MQNNNWGANNPQEYSGDWLSKFTNKSGQNALYSGDWMTPSSGQSTNTNALAQYFNPEMSQAPQQKYELPPAYSMAEFPQAAYSQPMMDNLSQSSQPNAYTPSPAAYAPQQSPDQYQAPQTPFYDEAGDAYNLKKPTKAYDWLNDSH